MGNIQTILIEKPQYDEREIILTLYCVNCKTSKVFKIIEALKNILVRNLREITYQSKCEKCGKEIGVGIKWV